MKKLLIPLLLAISLQRVSAILPYFDSFANATANGGTAFNAGSPLASQQNNSTNIWNGIGTSFAGPAPTVVAGSLSYPDLPQSSGNSVSFVPASAMGVRLNFNATITAGTVYYSYLLKITDISAVPTNAANNFFAGFSDGSVGQGPQLQRTGTRVLTKANGAGGFVLGLARNNTAADFVYDTTVHNTNETIFVVGSYELVGGKTNVNLWINPPASSFGSNAPPAPTLSQVTFTSITGALNNNGVQGFIIVCQNTTAPSGLIDELRIATNWSDVTGGDPSVLTQPVSVIKPSGSTVKFNITARGTPTLTYQWFRDVTPLSDVGNITGSSTSNLTVANISSGDIGQYSCVVANDLGAAQSASASLAILTDPIITNQPVNVITNFSGTATFTVVADGTAPFTYQWHGPNGDLSDGGNISGSHSNILTLSNVSFPDGGNYYVTVSNVNGALDSQPATLAVLDPYITAQPVPVATNQGATVTFHVDAAGTGSNSFNYQWFKGTSFLFNTGNISGADSPTLQVANVSSTDQASYYVTVIGSFGTATSSIVNLSVFTSVAIVGQPSPRTVATGVRTAFVVNASGSAPLFYQWYLDGNAISNANSSAYVIANAQTNVAGIYKVVVSNSFSSATSSDAPLSVSNTLTLSQSNLMVIRAGDGVQTLNLTGNSFYVDQYDTNGIYINTVTVPDSGTNALVVMGQDNLNGVNNGGTTGSCITRSLDGRFLVIAGYNTNLANTTTLSSSLSANIPRGVGIIESHGEYAMPVAATNAFDNTFWRAGIYDGTNNFWGGAGAGGTRYFGFDAPAVTIQTTMVNMRSMSLFNGDIYCAGAGTPAGVVKISGMPKTATNGTLLFAGSTGTFDMVVSTNGNLIYVADQRTIGGSGGGIQRWDFDTNAQTWGLTYTLQVGGLGTGSHGPRYLTADFSGTVPVIYTTSNDGTFDNNRLIRIVDTDSGATGTPIAFAGINQTFRGLTFGPVPNNTVSLTASVNGTNFVLTWDGSFTLQGSVNALGVYTNIAGATSPYTNNLGADAAHFFRLKH